MEKTKKSHSTLGNNRVMPKVIMATITTCKKSVSNGFKFPDMRNHSMFQSCSWKKKKKCALQAKNYLHQTISHFWIGMQDSVCVCVSCHI